MGETRRPNGGPSFEQMAAINPTMAQMLAPFAPRPTTNNESESRTMTKKTATLVKKLAGMQGDAALYRLSPPLEGYDENATHELVVVSAVSLPLGLGTETYIFPGDETGKVTDWGELPGSIKNSLSHEEALAEAGYEVES